MDNAIKIYEIRIPSESGANVSHYFFSYLNQGEYEEANKCFDRAIEMDYHFADAWHNKGISLGNLRKYEANKCFDRVIEKDPKDTDAWLAS